MKKTDSTGKRNVLSREIILQTAREMLKPGEGRSFSMRRLAEKLGVNPMAIYHYFPKKSVLIIELVQAIFENFQSPLSGNFKSDIITVCQRYRNILRSEGNLVFYLTQSEKLSSLAAERLYAAMPLHPELNGDSNQRLRDILIDYTHGFVLGELRRGKKMPGANEKYQRGIELIVAGAEQQN